MNSKPVVLITGGSGMVGKHLSHLLQQDYEVTWLVRKINPAHKIQQYIWNINNHTIDHESILKADYIIHLAGENLASNRWNEKNKQRMLESRTQSSKLLLEKLKELPHHVKAIACASAIGIYDDNGDTWMEENSNSTSNDFLADVVRKWEEANSHYPTRTVLLRIGIVLDRKEGAFPQLLLPLYTGVAPIFNGGKHYQSWIHLEDLCSMFRFVLEQENTKGIYNATAPQPVSYLDFMKTLQQSVWWPTVRIPVPSFLLKWILGEKSIIVLKGGRISSKKILDAGFQFTYSDLKSALKNILRK